MKTARLTRIGNSHGIIIPSAIIELFNITPETEFHFESKEGPTLVISVKKQPRPAKTSKKQS